ncbi:uncharacterized protein CPUR_08801 [Claviceps purpurea 20.1]|uniref:Uncharacterized protein n=1 Tax=Claviceps purpurea (strain 20.1) TaxID=1111077 RepID=M1VZD9_CLAP2|nr:uncharacterized protein CPUR_08801 [Claviceps purpurea 20.1]
MSDAVVADAQRRNGKAGWLALEKKRGAVSEEVHLLPGASSSIV